MAGWGGGLQVGPYGMVTLLLVSWPFLFSVSSSTMLPLLAALDHGCVLVEVPNRLQVPFA